MLMPRKPSESHALLLTLQKDFTLFWISGVTAVCLLTSTSHATAEEAKIVGLRPEKLFLFQGNPQRVSVQIQNPTQMEKTIRLRTWLEQGLTLERGHQEFEILLSPHTTHNFSWEWPADQISLYGQAVIVELWEGPRLLHRNTEVFSSHSNVWRVGIAGGHPVAFTASHVKDNTAIERAVERFRSNYVNTFEKFFWAPDDFADMTPTQTVWFSGQARYHENRERLQYMCEYGRRVGVLPTTYGKSIGSGSRARDIIRAHPEMVYGYGRTMDFNPDTEELSKWDVESDPYWQSTAWAAYNMNDPAVVQHGIDQIIGSIRMFGWAGIRFDGHFRARMGAQRVGDAVVNFTADEADRRTADNMRSLKEQVRAFFPDFVFGYNFADCKLEQRFQSQLREIIELCRDGGHIMDEYAKQITSGSHPYRRWADFAQLILRQTEQVRRFGGELFPMLDKGWVGRFQTVFTLAAGAHPFNQDGPRDLYRFATRYGELLWAPQIQNIGNPLGLVVIRTGILWQNYVRFQRLDNHHARLIIHLINPPLQESAPETAAVLAELARREQRRNEIVRIAAREKKTPDFSELDALPPLKVKPDPQQNISIRIVPSAFEKPWKPHRAFLLVSETGERSPLPLDQNDPYIWQLTVPELTLWSIVVVELEQP